LIITSECCAVGEGAITVVNDVCCVFDLFSPSFCFLFVWFFCFSFLSRSFQNDSTMTSEPIDIFSGFLLMPKL
jgi:hypothetical protein